MNRFLKKITVTTGIALICGVVISSCSDVSREGMVVVTTVNDKELVREYQSDDYRGFLTGGKLLALFPLKPDTSPIDLTNDYFSACSPDISFDAEKMVFAAQKKQDSNWQIYEMDLSGLNCRQMTNGDSQCTDPLYLPDGSILFSEITRDSSDGKEQYLTVLSPEGNKTQRITFDPGIYVGTNLLHDGRITGLRKGIHESRNDRQLIVMRPDGTKETLFYRSPKAEVIQAGEFGARDIYVLEKDNSGYRSLSTFDYNNPGKRKEIIKDSNQGDIIGMGMGENGTVLLCYRPEDEHSFQLYRLDKADDNRLVPLSENKKFDILEAVAVVQRQVPKKIPSEVKLTEHTGLLLCQDINFSGLDGGESGPDKGKAVKIEILGKETSLGIVDAEADGSVYLRIEADTPFRLQTLDREGEVVAGPSSWLNLRPNERRACVGCHLGNEIVPENRQPLSVLKDPIDIPKASRLIAKTK